MHIAERLNCGYKILELTAVRHQKVSLGSLIFLNMEPKRVYYTKQGSQLMQSKHLNLNSISLSTDIFIDK